MVRGAHKKQTRRGRQAGSFGFSQGSEKANERDEVARRSECMKGIDRPMGPVIQNRSRAGMQIHWRERRIAARRFQVLHLPLLLNFQETADSACETATSSTAVLGANRTARAEQFSSARTARPKRNRLGLGEEKHGLGFGSALLENPPRHSRFNFGVDPFIQKIAEFAAKVCDLVHPCQFEGFERRFRRSQQIVNH